MRHPPIVVIVFLSVLGVAGVSWGITVDSDRVTFSSRGQIVYEYGFQDNEFSSPDGYYPQAPSWHTHGVTYGTTGSSQNVVVLPSADVAPKSNVLADDAGNMSASIDTDLHYDMLAMDLAVLAGSGTTSILLQTYRESKSYSITLDDARDAQTFFGFATELPGDYFTGFVLNDSSLQVAFDNVTLGVVPEPASVTLLGTVLFGIAGFLLRRRSHRAG